LYFSFPKQKGGFILYFKQGLAPSGGLHQAGACTKQGLAPSGGLHQADACTKQGLAPSGCLHQATTKNASLAGGIFFISSVNEFRLLPYSTAEPSFPQYLQDF
jgi:hypothetical protein